MAVDVVPGLQQQPHWQNGSKKTVHEQQECPVHHRVMQTRVQRGNSQDGLQRDWQVIDAQPNTEVQQAQGHEREPANGATTMIPDPHSDGDGQGRPDREHRLRVHREDIGNHQPEDGQHHR